MPPRTIVSMTLFRRLFLMYAAVLLLAAAALILAPVTVSVPTANARRW